MTQTIDAKKHSRKKNLLPALDSALDHLDASSDWIARNYKQVEFNCCSSCIGGSVQFKDDKPAVMYNVQDYEGFRDSYKENREYQYWYGNKSVREVKGEYIYLQHYIPKNYGPVERYRLYKQLINVFNQHGIYVDWDWNQDQKLKVYLGKYKSVFKKEE